VILGLVGGATVVVRVEGTGTRISRQQCAKNKAGRREDINHIAVAFHLNREEMAHSSFLAGHVSVAYGKFVEIGQSLHPSKAGISLALHLVHSVSPLHITNYPTRLAQPSQARHGSTAGSTFLIHSLSSFGQCSADNISLRPSPSYSSNCHTLV
jgi:hypothetical protein